jgi:hypothetical protein
MPPMIDHLYYLKMGAEGPQEMVIRIYQTTRHHIPEENNLHSQHHKNFKINSMASQQSIITYNLLLNLTEEFI